MNKQDANVLMRVSQELKDKLDARAAKMGMGTSTMIRVELIKLLGKEGID